LAQSVAGAHSLIVHTSLAKNFSSAAFSPGNIHGIHSGPYSLSCPSSLAKVGLGRGLSQLVTDLGEDSPVRRRNILLAAEKFLEVDHRVAAFSPAPASLPMLGGATRRRARGYEFSRCNDPRRISRNPIYRQLVLKMSAQKNHFFGDLRSLSLALKAP